MYVAVLFLDWFVFLKIVKKLGKTTQYDTMEAQDLLYSARRQFSGGSGVHSTNSARILV
jgi:hypothetical protein